VPDSHREEDVPVVPETETVAIDRDPPMRPPKIGPYSILRQISQGNFTSVFLAESSELPPEQVAIKLLHCRATPEVVDWFEEIARLMATLVHPHILPGHAFADDEGHAYVAMPCIDAADFWKDIARRRMLECTLLCQVVNQIAEALEYAHGRNVIHGNLHPKHILLDRQHRVRLIGFGEIGPRLPPGIPVGNPHFLAPEQIRGETAVPATDIYALSEVAYFGLCGSLPFAGDAGIMSLLELKRASAPPSIRKRRPDLPTPVGEVLQRGMAIQPRHRFASAKEFAHAFQDAVQRPTEDQ